MLRIIFYGHFFIKLHFFGGAKQISSFVDLNAMHGTPPKIVYLNTGNLTTRNVSELLHNNFLRIHHYMDSKADDILELIKAP